jgi:hypothetical protein
MTENCIESVIDKRSIEDLRVINIQNHPTFLSLAGPREIGGSAGAVQPLAGIPFSFGVLAFVLIHPSL